jgi:hypothetical protein
VVQVVVVLVVVAAQVALELAHLFLLADQLL